MQTGGLTYAEVGATAGSLPAGYHHLRRSATVGHGLADFHRASDALCSWEVHRRAGLTVETVRERVVLGADVRIGWGFGPVRLKAPCRVVLVVDEANARGFAYGSLLGHPERGEESFTVTLADDGAVRLTVVAFSTPARWFSRLGAPVTRVVQARIIDKYLTALVAA